MLLDISSAMFSNLGTCDIWTGQFLVMVGGCPVHCRAFSSIPGLYSLDASSTILPVVTTKYILWSCQMSPGVQNYSGLRTTALDRRIEKDLETYLQNFINWNWGREKKLKWSQRNCFMLFIYLINMYSTWMIPLNFKKVMKFFKGYRVTRFYINLILKILDSIHLFWKLGKLALICPLIFFPPTSQFLLILLLFL